MSLSVRRLLASVSCASMAAALVALAAPAAQADLVSLAHCDNGALSQPFAPWLDTDAYKLAPGGDFEGAGTAWTLHNGASLTAGSESYGVTAAEGQSSLSLPAGASATSPSTCVNAAYPSMRLFARSSDLAATVAVSVVYSTAQGSVTLPAGVIAAGSSWQPTLPMLTSAPVIGALSGGTAQVSLQFTALTGTSQIDDVYVDPWGRCC